MTTTLDTPVSKATLRKYKRQCVSCRAYFPKVTLLKITKPSLVKTINAPFLKPSLLVADSLLNPPSSLFGRSLYCCNAQPCLHKLLSKQGKFLKNRLKISVLPAALYHQLEQHLVAQPLQSPPKI
jgi:predicted RNA-binding protein YlxR (DUF448 family)